MDVENTMKKGIHFLLLALLTLTLALPLTALADDAPAPEDRKSVV
jgi:Amt family ammonium transporter